MKMSCNIFKMLFIYLLRIQETSHLLVLRPLQMVTPADGKEKAT